ncbi:MAG: PEP-CTERM sorting domain-containing protein [Thermodesulfobacteriota bacterium]|nr:PEP-CTERM sorting domain-containing protein [Thermodesulfobacteriota bacterium]
MKRFLATLFLVFLVLVFLASWYNSVAAYEIDLTDRVSDVVVYSQGAFNDYGTFPAEFGISFSLVNPAGSSAGSFNYLYRPPDADSFNYLYRPPDADYNGILPVLNTDSGGGYSWAFSSLRTRLTFTNPVSAFSVDMGDKGEDVDTIYLALYTADGGLINTISGLIGEEDSSFHTLSLDSCSFEIAYADFWGVDSKGENTVYFNNISFDSTLQSVPLPGSLLLFGSGLVTCVLSRRKRRQGEL